MTDTTALAGAVDEATFVSISRFYGQEAGYLDAHDYAGWLPLLTEEFVYRIPVTLTRDDPSLPPYIEGVWAVDETRDSLANLWARRLEPEHIDFSWGEVPIQRVRRFITIKTATHLPGTDDVEVEANVLISLVHQSDEVVMTPAGRTDVLRRVDDGWQLVSRRVLMDETILRLPHLRLVI